MTDVPLPSPGDTSWSDWGGETEELTDLVRSLVPSQTTTKVLIIGSSNAGGQSASSTANSWAGRLATALAATHTFVNEAIGGTAPSYWLTPDGTTGRTPLEDFMLEHAPHVVICSFTAQNESGGPSTSLLGYMNKARAICEARGARFIGITPYSSNGYTSTQRDTNQRLVTALKARGLPLLNFSSVWGTAATIPAAIDSGDGLHLNDTGHLEQFRQIPLDYLKLTSSLDPPPRFSSMSIGATVPNPLGSGTPLSTNTFPAGSWTVAFHVKLPAADLAPVTLCSFVGSDARIRFVAGNQVEVTGAIVHPLQSAWTTGSEHHLALSYNTITGASVFYVDGVQVSSVTATTGLALTSMLLGVNNTNGFQALGYRFRNVAIYATPLQAADAAKLAQPGQIPLASLQYAASLEDGPAAPAGAVMASLFGEATILTAGVALV